MAGNPPPDQGLGDDFFEQILAVQPGYVGGGGDGGEMVGCATLPLMGLQLGSTSLGLRSTNDNNNNNSNNIGMMPLGLNLEHHRFLRQQEDGGGLDTNNNNSNNFNNGSSSSNSNSSSSTTSGINGRDSVHMTSLFPTLGQFQIQPSIRPTPPPPPPYLHQHQFHGQPTPGAVSAAPHQPAIRPRVRARRGQATDPHSIAERLRRVRITERVKALQELVPTCNKTDRAAMLDQIVDYVKFLRLQVKVLSMSRLGAAGAVAQLVADVPLAAVQGEGNGGSENQQAAWENWSNDGTEEEVAKLMEEDIGAAMQFLQSKALCIMPISLASAIFRTQPQDAPTFIKQESNTPS